MIYLDHKSNTFYINIQTLFKIFSIFLSGKIQTIMDVRHKKNPLISQGISVIPCPNYAGVLPDIFLC